MNPAQQDIFHTYCHQLLEEKTYQKILEQYDVKKEKDHIHFHHRENRTDEFYKVEVELSDRLQRHTNHPVIGMSYWASSNDQRFFFIQKQKTTYYGAMYADQGNCSFLYSVGKYKYSLRMLSEIGEEIEFPFLLPLNKELQHWIGEQPSYRLYEATGTIRFQNI